jgi:hypothetical protein
MAYCLRSVVTQCRSPHRPPHAPASPDGVTEVTPPNENRLLGVLVSVITGPGASSHASPGSTAATFRIGSQSTMSSRIHRSTPRRHAPRAKVAILALVAITVLVAAVLPACLDGGCCSNAGEMTVHMQMPCCSESTLAPRDAVRPLPATSTGSVPSPQMWAPVAVVDLPGASGFLPPRVQATLPIASTAHHEPSPPLFLLNAQFLI